MAPTTSLNRLLRQISACEICAESLPFPPRPVLCAHKEARIMLVGQAPGTRVHESGIPWNDPSGDTLRAWLDVDKTVFYDAHKFAIVPMGFCYPGKGASGDLPPRPECAITWHAKLRRLLPNIELILLIGQYAQRYYLGENAKRTVTDTVKAWREYAPLYLPTPHPSPRNRMWIKRNPWFEQECIPHLREQVHQLI